MVKDKTKPSVMKHYANKFAVIKHIIGKENPIVIEIGSHYGEDSLRFLETFKDIKLFCFEPDERNIKIFNKHVSDKRVSLYEVALSNETGEANFYQSYQEYNGNEVPEKYDWISKEDYIKYSLNNSGSSSLKKGYKHVLDEVQKVKTIRYDEWIKDKNIDIVDFVWIDVQGAEKDVLEGMGKNISAIKFIWIEYGETAYDDGMNRSETIRFMSDLGFNIANQFSSNLNQGDALFYNTKMFQQ